MTLRAIYDFFYRLWCRLCGRPLWEPGDGWLLTRELVEDDADALDQMQHDMDYGDK